VSDLIKDNLVGNCAGGKLPIRHTDIDTLRDLISWCVELKVDRYSHRRLGGLEQIEYLRLAKTLDAANKMLVAMRRDLDDGK
jgi:hypothetical protein